jgi:hypothetical protein
MNEFLRLFPAVLLLQVLTVYVPASGNEVDRVIADLNATIAALQVTVNLVSTN